MDKLLPILEEAENPFQGKHPPPALLAFYHGAPNLLSAEYRQSIQNHNKKCKKCRGDSKKIRNASRKTCRLVIK